MSRINNYFFNDGGVISVRTSNSNKMRILAIETSCDETAVAVLEFQKSRKKSGDFALPKFKILSNIVSSQVTLHAPYGGVVPNLAKREHQRNLAAILIKTLKEAKLLKIPTLPTGQAGLRVVARRVKNSRREKLSNILKAILEREPELLKKTLEFLERYEKPNIDLIAVTRGPGLEPALWVGINFAKALAFAWDLPIIGINHLEGHIFSVFLQKNIEISKFKFLISNKIPKPNSQNQKIIFPALALIVSGGHTELILIHPYTEKKLASLSQSNKFLFGVVVKKWLNYEIIGSTRDDAAGEAFDKVARILGLGYPGGPAIAQQAERWKSDIGSPISDFRLPRPMINGKDFDFSFSGLKTAVLYLVQDLKKRKKNINDLIPVIAYEFEQAVVDVLVKKTVRAAEKHNIKTIILCGGVSANKKLRRAFGGHTSNLQVLMPEIEFSGDNAAMIALAAYFESQKNQPKSKDLRRIEADGNLSF